MVREDYEDSSEEDGEEQQQAGGFSLKEMITGRIVSNSNSNECKVNKLICYKISFPHN